MVRESVSSALRQKVDRVVVYDNSERPDLGDYLSSLAVEYIKGPRMRKINMAKLRNIMLSLSKDDVIIMLDSDVVIPYDWSQRLVEKIRSGVHFTWMHYAYSTNDIMKPLAPGENNPNLGCSALSSKVKDIGFDERYERDEDIWLYAKLRKLGFKAEPTEGRCLHLNSTHARLDFRSSLKEAKRNLWRSKYDMRLIRDGLVDFTFLTGYSYYGSYFLVGVLGVIYAPLWLLYLPIIAYGIEYYGGVKSFLLNLIPGLALVTSLPYGLVSALKD